MRITSINTNTNESIAAKSYSEKKHPKYVSVITSSITIVLSIFFIYTGAFKLISIDSFKLNVSRTGVFSEFMVSILPYILALTEFAIAFTLILRPQWGNILFSSLMIAFSVYITYLNNNGLYEICGCGGILNGLSYTNHLLINILTLILSFTVILISKNK